MIVYMPPKNPFLNELINIIRSMTNLLHLENFCTSTKIINFSHVNKIAIYIYYRSKKNNNKRKNV